MASEVFRLAQRVLEKFDPKSAKVQELFGLELKGARVLNVALNALDEKDQIIDLSAALGAAKPKLHFSLIKTLKSKKLISRKEGVDNWEFTKDAVKKLQTLAGEAPASAQPPSDALSPGSGAAAGGEGPSGVAPKDEDTSEHNQATLLLDRMSLANIVAYVQGRIDKVDGQIAAIRERSEQEVAALEQERRDAKDMIVRISGEVT